MTTHNQVFDWQYESNESERIDKFLAQHTDDWSRSQIQQWIKNGNVTVNGVVVKANYKLQLDDEVRLNVPPPRDLSIEPEEMNLNIVFEDRDVIVINKERGIVVHPAPGHYSGTIVNGLLAHCKHELSGINGVMRPGIVHRIDKDTSGLLMIAKNDLAHQSLAHQLKNHTVTRKYVAIVHGNLAHQQGTINAPIGRDPKNRQQMAVGSHGKEAVTHFKVLEHYDGYSLIECELETGRTHQIRVHLNYIGHPLAGDPKYGPTKTLPINGQALHAKVIGFDHPRTAERCEFDSELPEDMQQLIEQLQTNMNHE